MTEESIDEEYTEAYLELSDRHQAFVDEYCISRNATEAYQKVYDCSYEVANAQGCLLRKKPGVAAVILEAMEASSKRCEIEQDWILINLKEAIERCMQTAKVLDKKGDMVLIETPNGEIVPAYTFQAMGAFKGLELAGKQIGMFKEKHELDIPNGFNITIESKDADNA